MHTVQQRLEHYCSFLPSLQIIDSGTSFEVKWEGSFGALVHKDSGHQEAIVCWEANPYMPKEKRIAWPVLATWLRENVK